MAWPVGAPGSPDRSTTGRTTAIDPRARHTATDADKKADAARHEIIQQGYNEREARRLIAQAELDAKAADDKEKKRLRIGAAQTQAWADIAAAIEARTELGDAGKNMYKELKSGLKEQPKTESTNRGGQTETPPSPPASGTATPPAQASTAPKAIDTNTTAGAIAALETHIGLLTDYRDAVAKTRGSMRDATTEPTLQPRINQLQEAAATAADKYVLSTTPVKKNVADHFGGVDPQLRRELAKQLKDGPSAADATLASLLGPTMHTDAVPPLVNEPTAPGGQRTPNKDAVADRLLDQATQRLQANATTVIGILDQGLKRFKEIKKDEDSPDPNSKKIPPEKPPADKDDDDEETSDGGGGGGGGGTAGGTGGGGGGGNQAAKGPELANSSNGINVPKVDNVDASNLAYNPKTTPGRQFDVPMPSSYPMPQLAGNNRANSDQDAFKPGEKQPSGFLGKKGVGEGLANLASAAGSALAGAAAALGNTFGGKPTGGSTNALDGNIGRVGPEFSGTGGAGNLRNPESYASGEVSGTENSNNSIALGSDAEGKKMPPSIDWRQIAGRAVAGAVGGLAGRGIFDVMFLYGKGGLCGDLKDMAICHNQKIRRVIKVDQIAGTPKRDVANIN